MRLNHYQSLYFDTADFDLYLRHHAGVPDRYKVRSRRYVESGLAFFEIKHKTSKKRTIKQRLQTPQLVKSIDDGAAAFLHEHFPCTALELLPKLWSSFTRITLVSKLRAERLTLDFDLSFHWGQRSVALNGLAVAELNQSGRAADSDFLRHMHVAEIRPSSFSKCHSAAYTEILIGLRHNR